MIGFTLTKFSLELKPRFHCTISIKELPYLINSFICYSSFIKTPFINQKNCLLYQMICEVMVDEVLGSTDKLLLHFDNIF